MEQQESADFSSVKTRLDEIVDEIAQEGISLDDALALYEEAVKLGLAACDLSEADILPPEEEVIAADDVDGAGVDGVSAGEAATSEADVPSMDAGEGVSEELAAEGAAEPSSLLSSDESDKDASVR